MPRSYSIRKMLPGKVLARNTSTPKGAVVTDDVPASGSRGMMRAVLLPSAGGPEKLTIEEVSTPRAQEGEALVKVHAAAITRGELEWPVDRLPAIPSYELSGVVAAVAADVRDVKVGDAVFALLPFDRDGAAAEYVATPAHLLVAKPTTLDHIESAAVPLPALSAWQALFDHGRLEASQRVLILGAAGGVGHLAVQIASARGAHVIAAAAQGSTDWVLSLGAHEVIDLKSGSGDGLEPVDLVFDTVGGERFSRSAAFLRPGGRMVSVAEPPPDGVEADYFVVEPNHDQLVELSGLADSGQLHPQIDSVFQLEDARGAFERGMAGGKRGKVVLRVSDD
jgi:NADPH:quinone reductase-like Zn-dependent oxidoreductase